MTGIHPARVPTKAAFGDRRKEYTSARIWLADLPDSDRDSHKKSRLTHTHIPPNILVMRRNLASFLNSLRWLSWSNQLKGLLTRPRLFTTASWWPKHVSTLHQSHHNHGVSSVAPSSTHDDPPYEGAQNTRLEGLTTPSCPDLLWTAWLSLPGLFTASRTLKFFIKSVFLTWPGGQW